MRQGVHSHYLVSPFQIPWKWFFVFGALTDFSNINIMTQKIKISQLQVACAHIFHNRTQEINDLILLTNKSYIISPIQFIKIPYT